MSNEIKKKYLDALWEISREFSRKDPLEMSQRSNVPYDLATGFFRLNFCGIFYLIPYPSGRVIKEGTEEEASITDKILFFHYLCHSSGLPLRAKWMSYHEFPGGVNHYGTFKIDAIQPIAKNFGKNPQLLINMGSKLGAKTISMGDAAITILALPMVPVTIVLWGEDEEFLASANIIFDASANTYLPIGVLDYLGEAVVKRLLEETKG